MHKGISLAACLALAACAAPAHPLVDMTDVDPVTFQQVYDNCEATAVDTYPSGPIFAGMVIGATVGMGMGAIIGGVSDGISIAEGYGALAGAGAGAVPGLVTAQSDQRQSLADCLGAHGYKVIGQSAAAP
jgi:hypothetical protein